MEYQALIDSVRERIEAASTEEAEAVVVEVLHALAHALPEEERILLSGALPDAAGEHLRDGRIDYDPLIDEHLFIGYLMTGHQTTGHWDKTAGGEDVLASTAAEEIERRARAVLNVMAGSIPERTLDAVCAALPPVLGDWFRGDHDPRN